MTFNSIARDFEIREGIEIIEIMNVDRRESDYKDLDLVLTWWQWIELKLLRLKMKLFY